MSPTAFPPTQNSTRARSQIIQRKKKKRYHFKSISHDLTKESFRIQKRNRNLIIDLDTTPLLLITIPEGQLPATLTLRCRQPKTHKVAAGGRRRVIRVLSAGMQDVRIRQELNITNIEDHVQRQTHAGCFQHAQGFLLCF